MPFFQVTVKFEVVSTSATYGLDYSVSSTDVVLISGEREKRVPVDIINDRLPELEETFTIRLVEPVIGGAELGANIETQVTILASDDPQGAFGKHYLCCWGRQDDNVSISSCPFAKRQNIIAKTKHAYCHL